MNPELQTFAGSLLLDGKMLLASYDLEQSPPPADTAMQLSPLHEPEVYNYALRPFSVDYRSIRRLCIINGMGVTLGDSIIGICALQAIKAINPEIHLTLLRPHTCPPYVDQIYPLAGGIVDDLSYLPENIQSLLAQNDVLIDMGNQLFRDDFASIEMHDFFLRHLGLEPETVEASIKTNRWLRESIPEQPSPLNTPYVLLNHNASTPLRSIPQSVLWDLVESIHRQHKIKVAGFTAVNHPYFIDLSARSQSTLDFIAIIRHASALYTCDSSALHIAAAFEVPTVCYFNAIKPQLRAAYYPLCESIDLATERSALLHQSDECPLLEEIENNYRCYLGDILSKHHI
ncbi:hypothetical protein KC222_03160 [Cedecea davisae]|uniref:ADP-heptose:LPS heptosyltransferase n=1 Tax=Cedecea davisae TaxID=158484 RepID=A0ABS6DCS7_9ENTR|nr:hypothetical protein [Cedecea davisae]MBU4681009.1 hypothetical protein [Cedecea davisae]MBU4685786.1 hypothetical protein [Cedecea davisae]